ALADAEDIQVSDDEFGHEIVHRAQQVGMAPQAYYDQLVRGGMAGAVYGDVRSGKALCLLLERVKSTDSAGNVLTLDDTRGAARTREGGGRRSGGGSRRARGRTAPAAATGGPWAAREPEPVRTPGSPPGVRVGRKTNRKATASHDPTACSTGVGEDPTGARAR